MVLLKKISLLIFPLITLFFLFNISTVPAYASFDLNDKTSNGNNLTNNNSVSEITSNLPFSASSIAAGLDNSASQYLSAPDSASLSITSKMTVEFWVKFQSLPASGNTVYLVSKRDDSINDGGYGFGLRNSGGTLQLIGVANQSADSTNRDIYEWNWTPSTGTWYHLALTIDSTQSSANTYKLLIDGVSQGNGTGLVGNDISAIRDSAAPLTIGCELQSGTAANCVDAAIDDVRIWNTVRTDTQINNNKSGELAGSESGLVAYYPMETLPVSPLDLSDKTTNGNNLTNNNDVSEITSNLPFTTSSVSAGFDNSASQYLSAPDSASLSITSKVTIELWAKFQSLPSSGNTVYLVSKRDDTINDGGYGFGLRNSGGTLQLIGVANQSADSSNRDIYEWNWTPSTNTWYHLALTIDSTQAAANTYKLLIDGVSQGSGTALVSNDISAIRDSAAPLTIGCELQSGSAANCADMTIDDVRIWNIIRSDSDISNYRNAELTGAESGLAAYYPFESLLRGKITYYTINDGTDFSRNTGPFTSGVATQSNNSDGSVAININSATGYADSGIVLYEGTLGDLPNFTVNGTGDTYSLNLWLDTSSDNEFFTWSGNVLTSLGGDTYALGPSSSSGTDAITGSSQFYLMSDGQNHSLTDLKNGSVSGINSSTKVAIWVGVSVNSGSAASTIQSVSGL